MTTARGPEPTGRPVPDPAPARQRVGRVKAAFDSATGLRRGMNLWPPFLLTGIRVEHVSEDFRRVRVRLRRSRLTSNYVGTQFGGSLFAYTAALANGSTEAAFVLALLQSMMVFSNPLA